MDLNKLLGKVKHDDLILFHSSNLFISITSDKKKRAKHKGIVVTINLKLRHVHYVPSTISVII